MNAFTSNATVYRVQANDRFYLHCSVAPISSHGQSQKLDRVWMNFVDTSADSWTYLPSCRRSSAAAIDVLFGIYRNATNFMAWDRGCRVSPAGIIPESTVSSMNPSEGTVSRCRMKSAVSLTLHCPIGCSAGSPNIRHAEPPAGT